MMIGMMHSTRDDAWSAQALLQENARRDANAAAKEEVAPTHHTTSTVDSPHSVVQHHALAHPPPCHTKRHTPASAASSSFPFLLQVATMMAMVDTKLASVSRKEKLLARQELELKEATEMLETQLVGTLSQVRDAGIISSHITSHLISFTHLQSSSSLFCSVRSLSLSLSSRRVQ